MRPRGLTVVELVVTTSIIALLLGVLIPVTRIVRHQARATVCASRVRQLLLGLCSYEAEHGTFPIGMEPVGMPASSGPFAGNGGTIDLAGKWWFDYSERVNHATGDGLEVLTCPSKRQHDRSLAANILCGNYGANLSVLRIGRYMKPYREVFSGTPLSSDQVVRPAETLLLVDGGYSLISWWHTASEPPVALPPGFGPVGAIQHTAYVPGMGINRDKVLWPGQTEDAVSGRHPGRTVNVGFVDGHVQARKADDLFVEKTGPDQWNIYPLWQPDRAPIIATEPVP
jgi:prepilin-type processing-associated H-X9-DG protein